MMRRTVAYLLFFCHCLQLTKGAGCHCYNNDPTQCYKFENREQVDYRAAARRCQVGGGSLAILDTPQVFDFVYTNMMQQDYWIGLLKVSGSNPLQAYWSDAKLLNQSLYAFNFQLDDVRHDCVRMRTAPVTRVADYPCLGDYYYVCQYNSVTNASQSSERTFHFDVTPDQVIDSPWSLQVLQCQDASCSQLRCSHACASTKSCRSFSYSHVIRACRLHGSDLTSLTSFASADKTWVSAEKQRNEPANCEDVVTSHPCVLSGVFTLHPSLSLPPFPVFCRMGDDDVNWLLLMRKTDNANFERTLAEYVTGFGDLEGDFWLGLHKMSMLTPPWLQHELHVQFPSGSGDVNATYSNFSVMTSAGGDYVIAYDAFTSGAEDYLGGIQGNALDRRPSSCPLCQAWWWGAGSGGACHCDPSLMMMRVVGRVH